MGARKRALLVLDLLSDFTEAEGALYCGDAVRAILPRVVARITQARQSGEPVVFICDRHCPEDQEFTMFPVHCVAGTAGAGLAPELTFREGDILVAKRRYSGFFATDLDLHLRERGIEELVLVGVCTNICVFYTAIDARQRGYEVTVVRDEVASFDPEAHTFALGQMEQVLKCRIV